MARRRAAGWCSSARQAAARRCWLARAAADAASRADIFRIYLEKKPFRDEQINCAVLGAATDKYSADAIRQIVENAASIPWRRAIETGEERPISQADVLAAVREVPADLAEWTKLVGRYEEFAKQSQTKTAIGFRKAGQPQSSGA